MPQRGILFVASLLMVIAAILATVSVWSTGYWSFGEVFLAGACAVVAFRLCLYLLHARDEQRAALKRLRSLIM
jgi:hypothetical protein